MRTGTHNAVDVAGRIDCYQRVTLNVTTMLYGKEDNRLE